MGKEEVLKKLNNLHNRIDFDIKRKNDQGLKDYKKMVKEIIEDVKEL